MRKYGYSIEEKVTTYQEIMQFCEKNGRLPKAYSSMKATTMTEEQLYEKNLHTRWAESSEKQIVDKYAGISIEKVPEKYKAIVE